MRIRGRTTENSLDRSGGTHLITIDHLEEIFVFCLAKIGRKDGRF